jgi:hypothetical protein
MEKVSRICWNSNYWKRPSGRTGKATSKKTFERENGYGHEEWLLDERVCQDGYHYGFLEPLFRAIEDKTYVGKMFDIHLYTITPSKERLYVGVIHNAECISKEQENKVVQYYSKKQWHIEMIEDICAIGGDYSDFNLHFNVRFKLEGIEIHNSNPIRFAADDAHIKCSRYILQKKKGEFRFEPQSNPIDRQLAEDPFEVHSPEFVTIVDPRHKRMQNRLAILLKKKYKAVYKEDGNVDIKAQTKGGNWHYFELKTASAKQSIRTALGQILEYCHYPNSNRASKMFIVTCEKPKKDDISYIKLIRNTYQMPVFLMWYSLSDDKVGEY